MGHVWPLAWDENAKSMQYPNNVFGETALSRCSFYGEKYNIIPRF